MTPLAIAQFMAAAAFFTVGLLHIFIWARQRALTAHLLFALVAVGSGTNAIAELFFYRATTIESFNTAFKWANSVNALWFVALVWFAVVYTGGWSQTRRLPVALTVVFAGAALANALMPYGFLYREITALQTVKLPWGESLSLAQGTTNPWRFLTDLAFIGVFVLVIHGATRLHKRGESRRAWLFGGSLVICLVFLLVQGYLVDTGAIASPYLYTYGFLLVVLVMSLELAGEVVRASTLSEKVRANEKRWRSLLENVQLLVAGVDREGRIDYANPFFTQVSGFTLEEVQGKLFTSFLPEEMQEERRQVFKNVMHGDLRTPLEIRLRTKAGGERTLTWSNVLLRDAAGDITGMLGIAADMTEQRNAEASRDQALENVENALSEVEDLKSRLEEEVIYLRDEIRHIGRFDEIVGQSDALKYVLHRVEQVAPLDTTVLIEGETGVGKELFARAIHSHSVRKKRPLVKINCATLPPSLIEAELFGHERGAFTGATRTRRGRFELADGGTLFLDEVGELPLELQGKLLRVLQDGELERVGGDQTIKVDVRVIAATNRQLKKEIEQGRFREDLYYRLHVYPITVPTLRRRKDDIPLLVHAFVQRFSQNQGKRIDQISPRVMEELVGYEWPGNVRELENVIERAVITTRENKLHLAARLSNVQSADKEPVHRGSLEDVQRDYIEEILDQVGWRIEGKGGAAELLQLHPNTLRFRMRKLGIARPNGQTPRVRS
jgi:PAS domain S-box-containing protein